MSVDNVDIIFAVVVLGLWRAHMLKYSRCETAKASNYFCAWYDGRSWTQISTGTTMTYLCFMLLTSLAALLGKWCWHFTLYEILAKGKWMALLLSVKDSSLRRLFRASLVLTEQVYIHALWTKSPFRLFRFAPRSQSSLEDLFALYVGKWIRKYWQFSKCLLWISMSPSCTG